MRRAYLVAPIVLLAGCHNHPLVGDVTDGTTTTQIVHKLRCEARAAIVKRLDERKLLHLHKAVLRLRKNLKEYDNWRTINSTLFSEFDKKIETHNTRIKANQETIDSLNAGADALIAEGTSLKDRLKKAAVATEDDRAAKERLRVRFQRILEKAEILRAKIAASEGIKKGLKENGKKLENNYVDEFRRMGTTPERYLKTRKNMDERDKALASSDPDPDIFTDEYSDRHTKSFRELFAIIRSSLSMQLDFKITENNNANIDGGLLTWPIHLGTVSLAYKGGRDKQRQAQRIVQVSSTFEDLSNPELLECPDRGREPPDRQARTYPIVGHVGVDEFVRQYFEIISDKDGQAQSAVTGTFTDTLTFTTKLSGQLNPSIDIRPVHPSVVKAGIILLADRQDLHVATLQIKPYSPPSGGGDPKLQITKIPNVTVNITEGADGYGTSIDVK